MDINLLSLNLHVDIKTLSHVLQSTVWRIKRAVHWTESFFFKFLLTHSYLPIIVECCWTAASNSRSSMVHSPMIAHSERKTSRGSCYSLSASPRAPQISSDCISACVCVCVLSPAVRSRPSVLQALIGGQPSWAPVRGGRAVCLSAVWSTVCRSALIPL